MKKIGILSLILVGVISKNGLADVVQQEEMGKLKLYWLKVV